MRFWLVCIAVFGASCEKTPTPLVEEGGEFFDPSVLEGAASLSGWSDVPCPGSSKDERSAENPSGILRGEVDPSLGLGSDVRVRLVAVGESFEIAKVFHETYTDGLGRFCFKLPPKVDVGPHLMVWLGNEGELVIRRMVLDSQDVNVGAVHEALFQLVQEHKPSLRVPNLINLHTVGYTAVDLLNDAQTDTQRTLQGIDKEVEYLKLVLISDERTRALLGLN